MHEQALLSVKSIETPYGIKYLLKTSWDSGLEIWIQFNLVKVDVFQQLFSEWVNESPVCTFLHCPYGPGQMLVITLLNATNSSHLMFGSASKLGDPIRDVLVSIMDLLNEMEPNPDHLDYRTFHPVHEMVQHLLQQQAMVQMVEDIYAHPIVKEDVGVNPCLFQIGDLEQTSDNNWILYLIPTDKGMDYGMNEMDKVRITCTIIDGANPVFDCIYDQGSRQLVRLMAPLVTYGDLYSLLDHDQNYQQIRVQYFNMDGKCCFKRLTKSPHSPLFHSILDTWVTNASLIISK